MINMACMESLLYQFINVTHNFYWRVEAEPNHGLNF